MNIVALVGNKGGAGKTTLAINIASALNQLGSTLLIDADPQGSSLQWKAVGGEDSGLAVLEGAFGIDEQLQGVDSYQYCVIDCPPSVQSSQTREALEICDCVVIPVLPSPLDLWASVHIEEEVNRARKVNRLLRPLMVINQMEPRTRLSQRVSEVLQELNLPVAETTIRRRVAYRNAILQGRSVVEMGKAGALAAQEIQGLIDELGFQ